MTKHSVSIVRLERDPYTGRTVQSIEAGKIERTFDQYKPLMFFVNSYLIKHGYDPKEILFSCLQGVNVYADNKLLIVWKEHEA